MKLSELLFEHVTIKNGTKVPKDKINFILDAIPKMLKVLKIENFHIEVEFSPLRLAQAAITSNFTATNATIQFKPVFVNTASVHELLDTLAHEIIHIWQKYTLIFDKRGEDEWLFKGSKYSPNTPWANSPWEHQAVLNSWQLVKKAGFANVTDTRELRIDHYHAETKGNAAKLHIKNLFDM
jgi:hypothetical protein